MIEITIEEVERMFKNTEFKKNINNKEEDRTV